MAAAVTSGATAILLQHNPDLTPDQVKAVLMKTASKNFPASSTTTHPTTGETFTSNYDIFTVGAGYLDLATALADPASFEAYATALSPTAAWDPAANDVYVVTNASSLWANSVVWGTNVFVNGTAVLWGSAVVWGTSTNQGFSVVWGTGAQTAAEAAKLAISGEVYRSPLETVEENQDFSEGSG